MLVDTHAHLNFEIFTPDLPAVIDRCRQKNMRVINVGSESSSSRRAVELAEKNEIFFASVAVHPIHIGQHHYDSNESRQIEAAGVPTVEEMFAAVVDLSKSSKVVAIGETGFDYFRLAGDPEKIKVKQRKYFLKHLALAKECDLPLIFHCRGSQNDPTDAYRDLLFLIKKEKIRGVIHCFGATQAIAQEFIDLGFYIGLTGIVTFKKKAEIIQSLARELPLERILIETDAPYLAPEPYRGQRNEPIYVELVAKKIAALRQMDLTSVIDLTGKNAFKLFNLS